MLLLNGKMSHKILSTFLVASLIATGAISPNLFNTSTVSASSTIQNDDEAVNTIFNKINQQREAAGLKPLTLDSNLNNIASEWSQQQAANKTMAHNPNYTSSYQQGWVRAGENVAFGYSIDEVVQGWMNSPGHKANILGQYTTTGIGLAYDTDGVPYYTQVFASYPEKEPVATPPTLTSHVALGVSNSTENSITLNIAHSRAKNGKYDSGYLEVSDPNGKTQVISVSQNEYIKTIDSLNSGTEYTFTYTEKWNASDGISESITSNVSIKHSTVSNDNSKIETVTNTTIKANIVDQNSIKVDWSEPQIVFGDIENFTIKATDKNNKIITETVPATSSSFTFKNLSPETLYNITVTANLTSLDGTKKAQNTSSVITLTTPSVTKIIVTKPSVLTISNVTTTSVDLNWTPPVLTAGKVVNYTVKTALNGKIVKTVNTNTLKTTITGLTNNTNYNFIVTSNLSSLDNKTKNVTNSNTLTKKTLINFNVTAPTNLVSKASAYNTIQLSWAKPGTPGGAIKDYTVTVSSGGKVIKTITVSPKSLSLNITGLTENVTYNITIKVNAVTTDGQNKNATGSFKAVKTPFSPASQVSVSNVQNLQRTALTPNSVTYKWTKPKTVIGTLKYTVRIQGANYDKTFNNVSGNITINGLQDSTAYKATITAHVTSKNGLYTQLAAYQTSFTTPKPITASDIQTILNQTNAYRKAHGLPALKAHTTLNTVSTNWSKAMASKKVMSHNPNTGKQIPAKWKAWGENVAVGYTAATVTKAWYNSPGHKANMLNKRFTHIGIGIAYDTNGRAYFTQTFAQY